MKKIFKWEIWLAKVRFEDEPNIFKYRPVLVVNNNNFYIISFKMTSQPARNNYWGEYSVKYYEEAGLKKQTVIRLSKKLLLLQDDFINKIGRLHPYDINEVTKLLNS